MAGQDASQNSLVMLQFQQLTSEIKENAEEIKKAFKLQESAKSEEDKANAASQLQYYREREDKLLAQRDKLGTGVGASWSKDELAEAVATKVKVSLEPTHQAMHDDIKSWHSSATTQASTISSASIDLLRRLLRYTCLPFDDTDPRDVLSADANEQDFLWDNTHEASQRARYMETIISNLQPLFSNRSIDWTQQVTTKGLLVKGLGHNVVAKSDELICARRFHRDPAAGCLVGIEMKKQLSHASRRQGEAEFDIFSLSSAFPFIQIVTDMQRGGFAYWKRAEQGGRQVVVERVLVGMPAMYDFLRGVINSLPGNIGQDEGVRVVMPPQLDEPERSKLVDPLVSIIQAPLLTVVDADANPLDDLADWYQRDQLYEPELSAARVYPDKPDWMAMFS